MKMKELDKSTNGEKKESDKSKGKGIMQDDAEKAISSMKKKREYLYSLQQKHLGSLRSYCDIYNVPEQLCKLNPNAYAPQSVSIGPLHYHKDKDRKLPITEARKFQCLNRLLIHHKKELPACTRAVAIDGWVKRARTYYPDTTSLDNQEFTEMMVVDGYFILGYLNAMDNRFDDLFVSNTSWQGEIMADMMKLENQLPLFVLRDLYAAVFGNKSSFSTFVYEKLIRLLARSLNPKFDDTYMPNPLPAFMTGQKDKEAKHFLDFLRRLIVPSSNEQDHLTGTFSATQSWNHGEDIHQPDAGKATAKEKGQAKHFLGCLVIPSSSVQEEESTGFCSGVQFGNLACWTTRSYERQDGSMNAQPLKKTLVRLRYSASQLKTAGVKFQHKEKEKASSILDIDFDKKKGVLSIPTFRILNNTEVVLRNLIVFEQNELPKDRFMVAYAAFLDDLINTVEDVNLLAEKGIIVDNLGNPENVADFFNNVTRHVSILNLHFSGVINDLEGYYTMKTGTKSWPI